MTYHKPVLLKESVDGLNIHSEGVYADLTFGGGGHSRQILRKLGRKGRLLAFDQDIDAIENVPDDERVRFIHANFRFLKNFLLYFGIEKLDGILMDLGISSHQIDEDKRGFTFRTKTRLDMRMNKNSLLTAEKIVNDYPGEELIRIFRDYGELRAANSFAGKIIRARENQRIEDSETLIEIVESLIPGHLKNKVLAQLFQALRIEVNDELGALKDLLELSPEVLKKEGRLVVLSYHSIEDRMVKKMIKTGNLEGVLEKDFYGNPKREFREVAKNVKVPDEEELRKNPRARSAKLRIAERI